MPRRKMPANGKASNGSSLLYDGNTATDHNNNHLLNNNSLYNQDNSESNERNSNNNSHSSTSRSSPNHIKKELSDYNDLADANSSQCAEDEIINEEEEEQLNDDLEIDEDNDHDHDHDLSAQLNSKTRSLLAAGSKLNGAPQSSPLSMPFTNEQLDKHAKLLNHLSNLSKSESLIKNSNKPSDGDSILESFNNFNNLTSLTNLNSLGNLSALNLSNILGSNLTFNQNEDAYGAPNEDDDEDSSNNMVITPDIGDYAGYQDDDLDDSSPTLNLNQIKQNLATSLDDEEELDGDLLGNEAKDDREGCRSLICDSNGIIIAEMVYRCMVCANISDSITDAQRHYQLKHIFNQNLGLGANSPLNNSYNWKANNNSANSSRSSNSSLAQMRQHHLLKKQLANQHQKLQRMQQFKIQQQRIQIQRIQAQKLKEQKLQKANQQRLLQLQQNQFQQQLQQNQRLEQLRQQQQQQQQLNDQLAQMQSNSESSPQPPIQQVINPVSDVNSLFLNPPLPGTVSKTPQSSHGSSRGGYVTCAVCSITKFYASVQRRYGQFTCMGCAKFFGRFLAKPKKFNCPNLGSCALNTSPRCKACLLLACINTYTIDEKRKMVVNANRPVQRPGGPTNLIGRASDSAKRKAAAAKA